MRVLVVDTYYPRFLENHYKDDERTKAPYCEQLEALMRCCFGTSDVYSRELNRLGHESWDVVVNASALQAAWAREHGMRFASLLASASMIPSRAGRAAEKAFQHRIALAQVAYYRPDVVYCQDLGFFRPDELAAIAARGILVAGQIASPAPSDSVLRSFGLICTSFPHFVDRFRALGVRTEYLPIGFDARVIQRLSEQGIDCASDSARDIDLSFVGSVNPRVHPDRVALLEEVCAYYPITIYGNGVDSLPGDSAIRKHFVDEAWGLEMYKVLSRSKITLNRHIGAAEGYSNNMRLFEATGVGALLLTDNGLNLATIFRPGEEVAEYDTAADLVARIAALSADESSRAEIAKRGQARTLSDHTYREVIESLSHILVDHLPSAKNAQKLEPGRA